MATLDFIRYETDQAIDVNIGNKDCRVKPYIHLVFDDDGANGKYGIIMTVSPPNVNIEYEQIFLKHNDDFDFTTGGEVELDDIQLQDGDKVWLSNQNVSSENGIYYVRSGTWDFYREVTNEVFVDLGARATDQLDGDLTRSILTTHNIDFDQVGFYSIVYYVINSLGVMSKVTRKVRVILQNASIVPTNSFAITDLQIVAEYDKDLIGDPIGDVNDCDACVGSDSSSSSIIGEVTPTTSPSDTGTYIRKDGQTTFTDNQSMGNNKLTDLAPAENDFDAVNLAQVTTLIAEAATVTNISRSYTAGESIAAFKTVYMNTDGSIYIADTSDVTLMGKIIGITTESGTLGESINVTTVGIITEMSGLTTGSYYFFNSAGNLTTTVPTSGFTQIMGNAVSATEFLVNMQIPLGL
jgi:hypothetical protein